MKLVRPRFPLFSLFAAQLSRTSDLTAFAESGSYGIESSFLTHWSSLCSSDSFQSFNLESWIRGIHDNISSCLYPVHPPSSIILSLTSSSSSKSKRTTSSFATLVNNDELVEKDVAIPRFPLQLLYRYWWSRRRCLPRRTICNLQISTGPREASQR